MHEELQRSLNRIEPATLFAETDLADVARQADRMLVDLDALLDKLAAGAPDFADAYRVVTEFLETAGARYRHTDAIVGGTLHALPRIAMFFGFRIADPAVKRAIFSLYIKEFKYASKKMREDMAALFATLGPSAAGGEIRRTAT
jgi:hypothetical protein